MTPNTGRRISRRTMISALGAGVVAAITGGAAARQWWRSASSGPAGVPSGVEGIARIGHAYLAEAPSELDGGRLRKLLSDAGATGLTGNEAELGAIQPVVREDARRGDLVMVDGWLLPISEVRAAALVALTLEQATRGPM